MVCEVVEGRKRGREEEEAEGETREKKWRNGEKGEVRGRERETERGIRDEERDPDVAPIVSDTVDEMQQ